MEVTTIQTGQPPHLVAVDAFHRRPSAVATLGDDNDPHPCLGQGRRQTLCRPLIAADERAELRADHQNPNGFVSREIIDPTRLTSLKIQFDMREPARSPSTE